eukprot:3081073-Pyramimonas_sp.AAC.1
MGCGSSTPKGVGDPANPGAPVPGAFPPESAGVCLTTWIRMDVMPESEIVGAPPTLGSLAPRKLFTNIAIYA